jgi:putative membrane protein
MMGGGGLIFIGLLVLLVFLFVRESSNSSGRTSRASTEDLLAERFARGEIDEDEYRRRRDLLRGG